MMIMAKPTKLSSSLACPPPPIVVIAIILGHLCCSVSSIQIRCLEQQRSLLLRLKQEISIRHYYDVYPPPKTWSWNDTSSNHGDCCLWEGVSCDSRSGHVVGLDLSSSSIYGGISSIFLLNHLRRLSLADNLLDMPFPSGFSNLSSLTHLNLSFSGFYGPIPQHELSSLEMLVSLDLSVLQFSPDYGYLSRGGDGSSVDMDKLVKNLRLLRVLNLDGISPSQSHTTNSSWSSLPDHLLKLSLRRCNLTGEALQFPYLVRLKSLTHLILTGNDLAWNVSDSDSDSGSGFSLLQFPHLIDLQLSSCGLYGTFPTSVFSHPTLQFLRVSQNYQLTASLPHFPPASSSSLQVLDLSETMFSGVIPDSIANLVSLQDLRLGSCRFHGRFPANVFFNPNLRHLDVSNNSLLTGSLPEFTVSGSPLQFIDISHTNLSGKLPDSIGNLVSLQELHLDGCSFSGSIPSSIDNLAELRRLGFSGNSFSGPLPSLASANYIEWLDFSSNNFSGTIPQSYGSDQFDNIEFLDLSNNTLRGQIPTPLFSKPYLRRLILASNQLEGELEEFANPSGQPLEKIHLGHNKLQGHLPLSIFNIIELAYLSVTSNNFSGRIDLAVTANFRVLVLLDLSDNHFQVEVTGGELMLPQLETLGLSSCNIDSFPDFLSGSNMLSNLDLSRNKIKGNISPIICQMRFLMILDLSSNYLNGSIPPCLASLHSLLVLRLRNNRLSGLLPKGFAHGCSLRTLDVNQNHLHGQLPESLGFCTGLQVIDVGKNALSGKFPVWLEKLPSLRILVLRFNLFGGPIDSQNPNAFPLLQIFDVSSNNFVGELPSGWFSSWKGMMKHATPTGSQAGVISFSYFPAMTANYISSPELYYQDSVTVTVKGIEREYSKILTIYILIDVSNNRFMGEIPETIAQLESLHQLNLSNNHFTGHIPASFEQLSELESLDLSSNKLSGNIPSQLTKLTFMSFMNLSQNLLTGKIPRGQQFDTFGAESYGGNPGLCGSPLQKPCFEVKSSSGSTTNPIVGGGQSVIDWQYYRVGIASGGGVGIILGIVLAKLVFGDHFVPPKIIRVRRFAVRPLRN